MGVGIEQKHSYLHNDTEGSGDELWIETGRVKYEERNRGRIHKQMVVECKRGGSEGKTRGSKREVRDEE